MHRSRSPAHSAREREAKASEEEISLAHAPEQTERTKHVGAELNEQCQSASLCSVLKWAFKDDGREGESRSGGVAIASAAATLLP